MLTLFRYTKLFVWFSIYRYYPSEIVEDIIVKNINDCGCVIIKFFQWIAPIIEMSESKDKIFPPKKLESIYERCNYHSVKYTKSIYEKEHNESFDSNYEIKELVASASMGQVYKVLEKKTGEIQAFKVLHPNLKSHINLFKIFASLLFKLPIISKWIQYYIPVHIDSFITNFESQINLVNEANNCLKFKKHYHDNPFYIIPEIFKCSQNTLFMSYEEGVPFETPEISEFMRTKCALLLQLFTKHNKLFFHFMHGDTHQGNWKIRIDDKKPRIVLYDFGYCWKIPHDISSKSKLLERTFNEIRCLQTERYEIIDKVVNAYYILLDGCCSKESIKETFLDFEMETDVSNVFPQILSLCRKTNVLIEPFLFQILIIASQLHKNIDKYHLIIPEDNSYYQHYYSKIVPDIFSFCKTHNIFSEYVDYLQEEYKYYKKNNQRVDTPKFSQLKSLAIS